MIFFRDPIDSNKKSEKNATALIQMLKINSFGYIKSVTATPAVYPCFYVNLCVKIHSFGYIKSVTATPAGYPYL